MNQVSCPHCGMVLMNDGSLAGQSVTCPQCGGLFRMPACQPAAAPQAYVPPAQGNPWAGSVVMTSPGFEPALAGLERAQPGSATPTADEEASGISQRTLLALAGLVVILAALIVVIWINMRTSGTRVQASPAAKSMPVSHWVRQLQTSPNPAERREAAAAIVELGPEAVATTLKTVVTIAGDGRSYSVDKTAIEYLVSIGPTLNGLLAQSLRAKDESVRVGAAYTFREMGRKAKREEAALEKALGDPSVLVLRLAAAALGKLGEDAAPSVGRLIALLGHEDGHVRVAAAEALGRIGPDAEAAVPALTKAVENDKIRQVRQAARQALNELNSEEVPEAEK